MSHYQHGYDAGHSQHYPTQTARHLLVDTGSLFSAVGSLVVRLLVGVTLASPFLLLGGLVAAPFPALGGQLGLGRLLVVGGVGYLAFAALYWLKGIVVALVQRGGRLWLLPLALCVGITCLLPALLVRSFVLHSFPSAGAGWGWGLAVAFGLFAYRRYDFKQATAPVAARWSYRRGYLWGLH